LRWRCCQNYVHPESKICCTLYVAHARTPYLLFYCLSADMHYVFDTFLVAFSVERDRPFVAPPGELLRTNAGLWKLGSVGMGRQSSVCEGVLQ
jgi:hypothetical protein